MKLACACAFVCSFPALASNVYISLGGPGGSVSRFNAAGGPASITFATPPGAVDMLLSANGAVLYVGTTNTGDGDVKSGAPALVAAINPATGAVLHRFKMPASVVKMVLNAAGDHIFATGSVATSGAAVLMSLNLTTGATAQAAIHGATPFDLYTIAISPDGGTVYIPVNGAIRIFNAATLVSQGSITLAVNGIVAPPAVTPDGATLLAAGSGSVYAVDLATRTLKKTIPITTSAAAFGSVLSPDAGTFYVSAGTLTAIDVASLSVKASVALGQTNPYRLGISPDGTTLFATDLTYGRTAVVNAASLTVQTTLSSIAPPFAVAVPANGGVLLLNENSNRLVLADTGSFTPTTSFLAGDSPGAAVFTSGRLFVPQVSNLAVQETPLTPVQSKPIADGFIQTEGAVALAGKVYANEGSAVRVYNPVSEKLTGSFFIQTGGGTVNNMAASGDGASLLATYVVYGVGFVLVDAGIVRTNTVSSAQQLISSLPFVPGAVVSSPDGARAYAVGYTNGNRVGAWDTQNNLFLGDFTIPGNPFYVAIAVSADGSTLYLVNSKGTVDFVNAATSQLIASLAVGTQPSGISLSADGTEALVTDSTATSVTVLDLTNRAIKGIIPVGAPSSGAVYLN